jgi:hypothetical protein
MYPALLFSIPLLMSFGALAQAPVGASAPKQESTGYKLRTDAPEPARPDSLRINRSKVEVRAWAEAHKKQETLSVADAPSKEPIGNPVQPPSFDNGALSALPAPVFQTMQQAADATAALAKALPPKPMEASLSDSSVLGKTLAYLKANQINAIALTGVLALMLLFVGRTSGRDADDEA